MSYLIMVPELEPRIIAERDGATAMPLYGIGYEFITQPHRYITTGQVFYDGHVVATFSVHFSNTDVYWTLDTPCKPPLWHEGMTKDGKFSMFNNAGQFTKVSENLYDCPPSNRLWNLVTVLMANEIRNPALGGVSNL